MKNLNIWAFIKKPDFQRGISHKTNKEKGLHKEGGLDSLQI